MTEIAKTPNLMKAWGTAARLRTLPIPTIQVVAGAGLAYATTGTFDTAILIFTVLVGAFITMGTNLMNDVIDFEKGADKPQSVGFLKVITAGIIPKRQIQWAGIACFVFAILSAIPLTLMSSGWILAWVIASVFCGYYYTAGRYSISYNGLSELFILVFYGGVCVNAAYYVQTQNLSMASMLCALQMGFLAILPNALNNLRDIHADAEDNKRTLAVRFGKSFARWEITVCTFLPFILGLGWVFLENFQATLIPLFLLPLAFLFVRTVWKTDPGPAFNRIFGLGIMVHVLFGALLMTGFFLR